LRYTSEHVASEVYTEITNERCSRFPCMLGRPYGWVPSAKTCRSPLIMAVAGEGKYGSAVAYEMCGISTVELNSVHLDD
jgi:hypothetical protein